MELTEKRIQISYILFTFTLSTVIKIATNSLSVFVSGIEYILPQIRAMDSTATFSLPGSPGFLCLYGCKCNEGKFPVYGWSVSTFPVEKNRLSIKPKFSTKKLVLKRYIHDAFSNHNIGAEEDGWVPMLLRLILKHVVDC